GQGTKIDYVQVSYCGDDAFEWFGGNVNSKYLIAYKSIDDDFDTDFGFSGRVQFGVVLRDPALADVSGSNGFESDNYNPGINATNPAGDAPYTTCVFSNITLLGPLGASATIAPNFQHGAHLRRNTRKQIYNTVIAGFPRSIKIQGASVDNAKNNLLKMNNSVIAGATTEFFVDAADSVRSWRAANEAEWFRDRKRENITTSIKELGFIDAFKQDGKPNFLLVSGLPAGNSPLLRGSYWDGIINDEVIISAELAQIKIYPNPATEFVSIDTKLRIKNVYIANSNGQLVKQAPLTNNQIDLLQLQPGVYFIILATEEGKFYNQKIIKQ
ncbi:MAG: T9SS type A sorting domain-containing protein, partial [Bacteroidota bacterium]